MKLFLLPLLYFFSLFPNQETPDVLVGGKFSGYRVYVFEITKNEVLCEVGGTNMKFGGEITVLSRQSSNSNNIYASSTNRKCYLTKEKGKLRFYYEGKLGKRKFKLAKKKYSKLIDLRRRGIFTRHFFSVSTSTNLLNNEFEKYKVNPLEYSDWY